MTCTVNRTVRFVLAGSVAMLLSLPAQSATRPDQPTQAWSAMAGVAIPALLRQAQDLPTSDMAIGDQPYCAQDTEIHHILQQDFSEKPVDSAHQGTELWGSDQMGTWTLVAPRPDETSCIIASGIGYKSGTDVEVYYETAGLL